MIDRHYVISVVPVYPKYDPNEEDEEDFSLTLSSSKMDAYLLKKRESLNSFLSKVRVMII